MSTPNNQQQVRSGETEMGCGFEVLISAVRKVMHGEKIEREEIRHTINYLWDKWPQGMRLGPLRILMALLRDPASLLSIPTLGMIMAAQMTPDVLCGLYDSIKDHGLYREDDTSQRVPGVVSGTGTGGKEIPTINVSTSSAIIAASAGGKILRSGTRGFFSTSGASDFLKANKIPTIRDLALVEPMISETGLAFIEGEQFGGISQFVNPMTQAQGDMKTLVTVLSHPFRHAIALLRPLGSEYAHRGITLPITREVAEALRLYRGFKRGIVVFGQGNKGRSFDEFSNVGPNEVSDFTSDGVRTFTLWPQDVGLPLRQTKDIEVREKERGYMVAIEVLQGKRARGDPFAELLAFNAGSMLYAGDFARDIGDGVDKCLTAIAEGLPYTLVEKYRETYSQMSLSFGE